MLNEGAGIRVHSVDDGTPVTRYQKILPWLRAGGLGVALYLGLLGWLRLPCPGGGCEAVLHGKWSSFLGISTGWWGAAVWLTAITAGLRVRCAAHHLLAAGSVVFVGLQAFVIGRFCPWCLLHAAICWSVWSGRRTRGPRVSSVMVGVLTASVLIGSTWMLRQPPAAAAPQHATALSAAAFDWLREPGGTAPATVMVVSVTCPHCLDLLAAPPPSSAEGPLLAFLTSEENRELTELLVAAVLVHPAGPKESFPALMPLVLARRDLMLAQPRDAAQLLAFSLPDAETGRATAAMKLDAQQNALRDAGIHSTPVVVSGYGDIQTSAHWPESAAAH